MGKTMSLLKKADLDASTSMFFDRFFKVIVAIVILAGTSGLDRRITFGTVISGVFLTVVILNGEFWLYYRKIAADRNDPNLTAIPIGLQTGRMFIWLYSITLPVLTSTGNANLAFKTDVLVHLVGGIIFIIGAFVVPAILKIVSVGALFDSLVGRTMVFLTMQSMNGILKTPLVGRLSLVILPVIYLGRVEVKLPATPIAIVIGSVMAWVGGAIGFGAVTGSPSNPSFYVPLPVPDIFNPDVISAMIPFLPTIIVFSLNEVIIGIQTMEQAKECGDAFFTTTKPPVLYSMASIMGACFGNPLAVGLYQGYPGWKKTESGTGYHLGVITLYALVGLTGLPAIINVFIPEAVVLPILAFIGIPSHSQAFKVMGKRYYSTAITASLPVVMNFTVDDMKEGVLPGSTAFDPGSVSVGLLVSCVFVFTIDNNQKDASITNGAALVLTAIGMIYSPGILGTGGYAPGMGFVQTYIVLIIVFAAMHATGFNRKKA